MRLSIWILLIATAAGAAAQDVKSNDKPAGWDPEKAARFMDDRMDLWFEKAAKLKTGEGKTTCISCHAVVPYLLARPMLRKAMHVNDPTPQEARLLREINQRVETYASHEPLYGSKEGPSRGTEAVLNALILTLEDVRQKRELMSEPTRKAFRELWERQRPDGAWDWLDFGVEPDESADAQYFGAALGAIATGAAPGLVSKEGDSAVHIDRLRGYLGGKYAVQNRYNRLWALLASTRLAGLLNSEQRETLIAELLANQNEDGGWSLSGLGPWRWSKATAPFAPPGNPDPAVLANSDAYATGLIAYVLRQTGAPSMGPALKKAADWLKADQKELSGPHPWKVWQAPSLNHDREHGGAHGDLWKRMVMWDGATAFAVMALVPAD